MDADPRKTALPDGLLRRFRPIEVLGSGGGGTAYLVEDRVSPPSPKVLKVVRQAGPDVRKTFLRREFDVVRGLRHPGLVTVFDFGEERAAGLLWFTSELVTGPDLLDASEPWTAAALQEALATLGRTLQFIHHRGFLHNDIKPSNIRVPAGPESARLLDFGLASPHRGGSAGGGTTVYMPPERLRTHGAPPSAVGDLYSLGVVIYACATRRLPFEGQNPAEVLQAIARGAPPARLLRPDVPASLDAILSRLMSPAPGDRFASATELLAALDRDAAARAADPRAPSDTLPGAELLGREELVGRLRREWELTRDSGGPRRMLIVGEAGLGKSRLLTEVRQRIELGGGAVAAVQAHRGAAGPWSLLSDAVRYLAGLPSSPPLPAALEAVGQPAREPAEPPGEGLRDAFVAYAMACARAAPVALFVDDMSWGDEESVSAILDLAQRPGHRLLLVAAAREESAVEDLRSRWQGAGWPIERLGPLPEAAQHGLLESLFPAGVGLRSLFGEAVAEARGNPLALEEIARSWVDAGAVRRTAGAWRLVPDVAVPPPRPPLELISARLARLPSDGLGLVRLVALHERPVPRAALGRAAGAWAAALPSLIKARLLADGAPGVDVRHPLVRQAAVDGLSGADRPALHRRLAEALEADGAGPDLLWRHFLAAGDVARGLRHGLAAGRRAVAVDDCRTGRTILDEVLRVAAVHPEVLSADDKARAHEALASCFRHDAPPSTTIAFIERVLPEATAWTAPRLRSTLGRCYFEIGQLDRAEALLREVQEGGADLDLVVEAGYWRAFVDGNRRGEWMHAREIMASLEPLARRLPSNPRGRLIFGRFCANVGRVEYNALGAAAALARLEELPPLPAFERHVRGDFLMEAGRVEEALAAFTEAEAVLRESGSMLQWRAACRLRGYALHHHGDMRAALELLHEALRGVHWGEGGLDIRSMLADLEVDLGDPQGATRAIEVARATLVGRRSWALELVLGAGLRSALWLGGFPGLAELEASIDAMSATMAPVDQPHLELARAMRALLHQDAAEAERRLQQAVVLGARFRPLFLPRYRFYLAYAQALRGAADQARQTAAEAEAGYRTIGNAVEAARARALGEAIAEGRVAHGRTAARWAALQEEARRTTAGDAPHRVVTAAVTAAGATAAWLLAPGAPEPAVLASAGSCGAAEPLAWRSTVEPCLAAGQPVGRGVGVALPLEVDGCPAVLVVEDRCFPGSFTPEAATFAALAARRTCEDIVRERLERDLGVARRTLEDLDRRTPSRRGPAEATIATAGRSRARRPSVSEAARLVDLTLGVLELRHGFDEIVGRGRAMRRALRILDRLVDVDVPVLVVGETGTGKELFARALHEQGPRAAGPFVAVNCGAIPPALAESELFGHEPGAFTGAGTVRHKGYLEQASGGTLFLDEVGELDPGLQVKFLRALEHQLIQPVGSEAGVQVDLRIVAATNRDLRKDVQEGRFRQDLYYRLAVVELKLPPLRERPEDIPELARRLLATVSDDPPTLSPEALDAIVLFQWPGNVRELRNELERASTFCSDGIIRLANLSPALRRLPAPGAVRAVTLRDAVQRLERHMIATALEAAGGVQARAAKQLGLTPAGLLVKRRRLGMKAAAGPPRKRRG